MELALLLVVLVIAELALTVWFLARQKGYNERLQALTGVVQTLEHDVTLLGEGGLLDSGTVHGAAADAKETAETKSLQDLVSQATPEDLEKAQAILKSLGLGD